LVMLSEHGLHSQAIHATPYWPLDQAVAATPAGGTLYIDGGAYAISTTIMRTSTIHIICDAAATITSDAQPTIKITGHSADGSSIVGCNIVSGYAWQVCPALPAAAFPATCTSDFVAIARFAPPGSPVGDDAVGYPPTVDDLNADPSLDVWGKLTPTQQANTSKGPAISFLDVNHIDIEYNKGYRLGIYAQYSLPASSASAGDVDIEHNDIICGSHSIGCVYVGVTNPLSHGRIRSLMYVSFTTGLSIAAMQRSCC